MVSPLFLEGIEGIEVIEAIETIDVIDFLWSLSLLLHLSHLSHLSPLSPLPQGGKLALEGGILLAKACYLITQFLYLASGLSKGFAF